MTGIVVNDAFAKTYLPDSASVIGQPIGIALGAAQTYEVGGAVGDVRAYGLLVNVRPEV